MREWSRALTAKHEAVDTMDCVVSALTIATVSGPLYWPIDKFKFSKLLIISNNYGKMNPILRVFKSN
jgi:hypothetical protein